MRFNNFLEPSPASSVPIEMKLIKKKGTGSAILVSARTYSKQIFSFSKNSFEQCSSPSPRYYLTKKCIFILLKNNFDNSIHISLRINHFSYRRKLLYRSICAISCPTLYYKTYKWCHIFSD